MKNHQLFIVIVMTICLFSCSSKPANEDTLTIVVTPPSNFNAQDTVHLVGDFNDWALSGTNAYALDYVDGKLVTEIANKHENIVFGFVKNSDWTNPPSKETGNALCTFLHQGSSTDSQVNIKISAWKNDAKHSVARQTLSGNVTVLKAFAMEQFNRTGNISIYLPPSYQDNSQKKKPKKYPVLYMLDGQNVFDESTAHSNEWRVDESLQALIAQGTLPELIVVAIDNGPRRWNEYNPWHYKSWQTKEKELGEGEKTIGFIKYTLKPYIDSHYSTQSQKTSTGLAGSSLGGLMALYAAMEHSDTFGFVAAFSPSLAIENMVGNNVLFTALKNKQKMDDVKIYFDMGKTEYGNYEQVDKLEQLLLQSGADVNKIKVVKDDLGRHCELDWSKRFPAAIAWLLG